MDTNEKVVEILKELSGLDEIQLADSLQSDVGLDSLGMVTLLIELETVLEIELKESDMNPFDLKTVSDVVALACKYVGGDDEKNC